MNTDSLILKVQDVHKSFSLGKGSSLEVLKGINLTIRRGEIIAIVGASGAGKSTLLHIMGGLDRPTKGTVISNGHDIFALDDEELAKFRNREVGFVFQFHHLLPEFTAIENAAMPAMILGKRFHDVWSRASELLQEVGLEHRIHHKPSELSGGEQQRVAVARALMNSPRVVLADEPSGNLDTANSLALHSLILELNRKKGQTFVIVTHNPALSSLAHRIAKIADGRIQNQE